ncbi:unnamed protein product [Moneuplotes crassus]|uniref:Uncharacterized protein n=1 Tax=Euplotes crassus TaxID=5936 RepID=A0AAD1UEI2_EUPCR|nr:unnamed protein product [Moneuplotes crassus]
MNRSTERAFPRPFLSLQSQGRQGSGSRKLPNQDIDTMSRIISHNLKSKGKLYKLPRPSVGVVESSARVKQWNTSQGLSRRVIKRRSPNFNNSKGFSRICCNQRLSEENKASLSRTINQLPLETGRNGGIKMEKGDFFSNKRSGPNLHNLRYFSNMLDHSRSPESSRPIQKRLAEFYIKRHLRQKKAISHSRISRSIETARKMVISHFKEKYNIKANQKERRRFKNMEISMKNRVFLKENLRRADTLTPEGKRLVLHNYANLSRGLWKRYVQSSFHTNAIVIQKNVRGFLQRLKFKHLLYIREASARMIQKKWKDSRWKRLVPKMMLNHKNKAATKIQKVVKGYFLRKKIYKQIFLQKQEELAICHAQLKQKEMAFLAEEDKQKELIQISVEEETKVEQEILEQESPRKRKKKVNPAIGKVKAVVPHATRRTSSFASKKSANCD